MVRDTQKYIQITNCLNGQLLCTLSCMDLSRATIMSTFEDYIDNYVMHEDDGIQIKVAYKS